jgi:lipopolysaccharide export system protein LptA
VAAVGVACAVGIYVASRKPPAPPPLLPPILVSPDAVEQGAEGTRNRSINGRERFKIDHERYAIYADGRAQFFKARLSILDENVTDVWADLIQMTGFGAQADQNGRVELQGNVRVVTGDGLELRTERARYDDESGLVTIQGPFTYAQGRITGEGVDGKYSRGENVLSILDRAHASVAPGAEGETATEATSKSMTLQRTSRRLHLERGARIVRQAESLAAETATLQFSADEQHVSAIELRGKASVTPSGVATSASPPQMTADDIDLTLHDGGQLVKRALLQGRTAAASIVTKDAAGESSVTGAEIDAALGADGTTLVGLDAKGRAAARGAAPEPVVVTLPASAATPAREVRGNTLTARGASGRGLQSARFAGAVIFTERPASARAGAPPREATSNTLDLTLAGRLSAVDKADFQGGATFKDGATSAKAGQAIYDAANRQLNLRATVAEPGLPRATTSRATVDGREIDVWLDSQDVDARHDVEARIRPSEQKPAARAAGLFDADKLVVGRGASLRYRGGTATFEGTEAAPASVVQDESDIKGGLITLATDTNGLTAERAVVARFSLAPARGAAASGARQPVAHEITAAALVYDDASRTAVATGAAPQRPRLESTDTTVESDRLEFTLAAGSRALAGFVATGGIDASMPDEPPAEGRGGGTPSTRVRRAAGDRLEYSAADDRYVLTGKPSATLLVPNKGDDLCTRYNGERLVLSPGKEPSGNNTGDPKVPCNAPIRR